MFVHNLKVSVTHPHKGRGDIVDFVKDTNTMYRRELRGKHNMTNWESGLTVYMAESHLHEGKL